MLLYLNPPSPCARKAVVVAHEVGIADTIEIVKLDPWSDPKSLLEATPLCKVPALKTNAGELFLESGTICEFLMEAAGRPLPTAAPALRDPAARRHRSRHDGCCLRLGDREAPSAGEAVAGLGCPATARAPAHPPDARGPPGGRFDLGDITLACMLAYLDFRLDDLAWRHTRPDLSRWLDAVNVRPSMVATLT